MASVEKENESFFEKKIKKLSTKDLEIIIAEAINKALETDYDVEIVSIDFGENTFDKTDMKIRIDRPFDTKNLFADNEEIPY